MRRLLLRGALLCGCAIILLSVLVPALAAASVPIGNGAWVWQNPLPEGNDLVAVSCPDGRHAWTVGAGGALLSSSNEGQTWTVRRSGTTLDLNGVAFADATHGWIVGRGATLRATTNGGRTWRSQHTGLATSVQLTGVACVGRLHVWAVGTGKGGGVLARTTNGGKTWRVAIVKGAAFTCIDFSDALHGCAAGAANLVLSTSDGGKTWIHGGLDESATTTITCVAFADRTHGWAGAYDGVNYAGYVLHTSDGGKSWHTQDSSLTWTEPCGIGVVDATHAYAACSSEGAAMIATSDGATWKELPVTWPVSSLLGIVTDKHDHGIVVGSSSTIETTTDGSTWTPRLPRGVQGDIERLAFSDPRHGWSASGDVMATSDAGAHWRMLTLPVAPTVSLWGAAVSGTRHVWLTGSGGTVLASTDGGATWASQVSGANATLWAPSFSDTQNGVVAAWSNAGAIFYTHDGGATWHPATLPAATGEIYDLAHPDASDAVAVGSSGVLRSTDGGETWVGVATPIPSGWHPDRVAFGNAADGWAEFPGGICATTDGGATWRLQHLPGQPDAYGVAAYGAHRAWVVNVDGAIDATVDGGAHWIAQSPGITSALFAVAFPSATRGYVCGRGGLIAATSTGGWHSTARPVTRALRSATVKAGGTVALRYEVLEPKAPGRIATVTIVVRTRAGKTVATLHPGDQRTGIKLTWRAATALKKGSYRWYVYATDAAGHHQSKAGTNALVVK